jgi:hypothetical protein
MLHVALEEITENEVIDPPQLLRQSVEFQAVEDLFGFLGVFIESARDGSSQPPQVNRLNFVLQAKTLDATPGANAYQWIKCTLGK